MASHDGANSYLAAVMIDAVPDRVELRLVASGASSTLATALPTFAATNTLQLVRNGTAITVILNSATVVSYTLTNPQDAQLGAGTRAGLFGGNVSVFFDDFLVSSP